MADRPERYPGLLFLLLGSCFFVLAGGMYVASGDATQLAEASVDWPTADGQVTTFSYSQQGLSQREIDTSSNPSAARNETRLKLDWEYTYVVDGTTYTSRRDGWGDDDRRSSFALGSDVTVHYDPDDPSVAVLYPDTKPMGGLGTVLIPLVLGGYLVYGGLEKRKHARAEGAT